MRTIYQEENDWPTQEETNGGFIGIGSGNRI